MHIYDFITDTEQYSLKTYTGNQPFEKRIASYIMSFFETLNKVDNKDVSKYLNTKIAIDPNAQAWFDDFLRIFKNDKVELVRMGWNVWRIYTSYLSGQHQVAVALMVNLLREYELTDSVEPQVLGCFLRGRWYTPGTDINDEKFYYHIPFNQRFLIKNQRFSFSGLPLVYAGQSMMAVYNELNAPSLDEEAIASCMLAFDHLIDLTYDISTWMKHDNRSRIYDITNEAYEIVNDHFYKLAELKIKIPKIGTGPAYPEKFIIKIIRKFFLSHFCTFLKTTKYIHNPISGKKEEMKDPHFIEEYVIPQLLMEAVRQLNYDGIIYPSTKFIDKKITIKGDWSSNIYQHNLAMFSVYKPAKAASPLYDSNLFEVLKVHTEKFNSLDDKIFKTKKIKSFDAANEVSTLKKSIKAVIKTIEDKLPPTEANRKLYSALLNIEKKISLYENILIDGRPYLESLAGKIDIVYQIRYFQFIRNQVRKINEAIFQKMEEEEAKTGKAI